MMRIPAVGLAALVVIVTGALSGSAEAQQRPAQSEVVFRSELPKDYQLEKVRITVDGYVWEDGPVAMLNAGTHSISVVADYRFQDSRIPNARTSRFAVRSATRVRVLPSHIVVARAVETEDAEKAAGRRVRIVWQ